MIETLTGLRDLRFDGRGESYVETAFLYPLLEYLGYGRHKDYEILIHGDDRAKFKLKYPPVEKGAKAVKRYNPDYIPTIRKKAFWIIEAKSPSSVSYPFDYAYLVQGLQYCIHPEIQAAYLVISTGKDTCVYDPYSAVFLDGNFYEPIFHFSQSEIVDSWPKIYALLSIEKLRERVEAVLTAHYERLASSSLDEAYPESLWRKIGNNRRKISSQIKKHRSSLQVQGMDDRRRLYQESLSKLSATELFDQYMDFPLGIGKSASSHYVEKRLVEASPETVFDELTRDHDRQSIFRKEHTFVALCELSKHIQSPLKDEVVAWMTERKDAKLNKLNRNETLLLRMTRRLMILSVYPTIREQITEYLKTAPELIRFVQKPTTLEATHEVELLFHRRLYSKLLTMTDDELDEQHDELKNAEKQIETDFVEAYQKLPSEEQQIGGYEWYGLSGRHPAFENIMVNMGVIPRSPQ